MGAEGAFGSKRAMGAEGAKDDEGAVRWLGHHSNRLYDFMGLLSKMSEWVTGWTGYPLDY